MSYDFNTRILLTIVLYTVILYLVYFVSNSDSTEKFVDTVVTNFKCTVTKNNFTLDYLTIKF